MSAELIIGLVTLAFVLWWFLSPPARLKKLGDQIPGPETQPIFGNLLQVSIAGPKSNDYLGNLIKEYGKTFRLWLGRSLFVFILEPADLQMIFTSQNFITKAGAYRFLENWLGTGLLLSTGELWQHRRKAITPTFHFKILEDFVPVFNRCGDVLVDCLSDKPGKVIDIEPFVSNAALDVITESAMGIKVECQTKPQNEYVESIVKLTKSIGKKMNNPWLAQEPLYTLTGIKSSETKYLGYLESLPKKVMEEKKLEHELKKGKADDSDLNEFGMKKRLPFLERLLEIKRTNGVAFRNDQDIMDEVTTFMFEGHDTTTACLTFTVYSMAKHQDIQENVYKEVSAIISDGQDLRIEDLNEMKYLERVIKESLRMYPPVPMIGRSCINETTFPSGHVIPAGSVVRIPIFLIHRHPDYFDNPDKFDPDRYLEEQKHPYVYVPFSAGPRNCIGQKFAMLELKALLSKMVYKYKITPEGDPNLSSELILRPLGGVKVTLARR